MIDWTKPLQLTRRRGTATLMGTLRGSAWPRIVKVTPPEDSVAETVMYLNDAGHYEGSVAPVVENSPVVRTVTRYFVAHANDSGDACNIYRDASHAKRDKMEKYTGILGKIDWTITDGKSTDQVMTVLESWNAPTPN